MESMEPTVSALDWGGWGATGPSVDTEAAGQRASTAPDAAQHRARIRQRRKAGGQAPKLLKRGERGGVRESPVKVSELYRLRQELKMLQQVHNTLGHSLGERQAVLTERVDVATELDAQIREVESKTMVDGPAVAASLKIKMAAEDLGLMQ